MDVVAIATALIASQVGQAQLAVAAKIAKMNADQEASVVQLLDAGQANLNRLANVAPGLGANLDISV